MLVLLGSEAYGAWARPVYARAIAESANANGRVLVVPTAIWPDGEDRFVRSSTEGVAYFEDLRFGADTIPLRTRQDAYRDDLVRRVDSAALVMFSGGHPEYLVTVLRGTPLLAALVSMVREGVSVGGCSAGMWMWGEMVPNSFATTVAEHSYIDGLGIVTDCVLVPHWNSLDELLPGLRDDVLAHVPRNSVIVAAEDRTALIGNGRSWRVDGEGRAFIRGDGVTRSVESGEAFTIDVTQVCPGRPVD